MVVIKNHEIVWDPENLIYRIRMLGTIWRITCMYVREMKNTVKEEVILRRNKLRRKW